MSRVAARPIPSTSGSLAVYTNSYNSDGLKPLFRQSRVGSGVPGNGVVRQSANAHSLPGTRPSPVVRPSTVSEAWNVSEAFEVSSVAAAYRAVPIEPICSSAVFVPAGRSLNRDSTDPVTADPSLLMATGTRIV